MSNFVVLTGIPKNEYNYFILVIHDDYIMNPTVKANIDFFQSSNQNEGQWKLNLL